MRVDGSIKTVTAGVTTLDDKKHNGTFAKVVDNLRCNPTQGLVTRPGADLLALYTNNRENVVSFSVYIENERYWVVIIPEEKVEWQIGIARDDGTELRVNSPPISTYFNSVTSKEDIAFTVVDDIIYIVNKKVEVRKASRIDPYNRSSMIVVKQAPAAYSKVQIEWTASDNVKYEIELEFEEAIADRGTNTVAEMIADAIKLILETNTIPDNVYVQGSTVLYQRADEDYAQITGTDGARDAVIATINADTPDINNLGKYAGSQCVVQIKPDPTSDRGSFYMKADPIIETDTDLQWENGISNYPVQADPITILTCGQADIAALPPPIGPGGAAIYVRGYMDGGHGSISSSDWKGRYIMWISQIRNRDQSPEDCWFNFLVASTEQLVAEDLEFMYFIDVGTGQVHITTNMQFVGSELDPDSGTWVSQWSGNGGFMWEEGQVFEVYDEYSDAIYGKLPEVRWTETADPNVENYLEVPTMPHVLGLRADGEFAWGTMSNDAGLPNLTPIRERAAGSEDTNPMPVFIDNTINDIGRFQDRLVLLSNDTTTMSVTKKPHGWFRETVTQQLANDPISMQSSSPTARELLYIVSHNNDALLFSQDAQYKIAGSIGVTSQNAAMPQTTAYHSEASVKPISNGSDVYFAISYSNEFSGVSRFSVDKDSDNQDIANPITNHVQEYIKGTIKQIASSTTLNMLFVITYEEPYIIYVYEAVESRQDPQVAWARWVLTEGADILYMDVEATEVSLMIRNTETNDLSLVKIGINNTETLNSPRKLYLDLAFYPTNVTNTIEIPDMYPATDRNMMIVEGEGCPTPGRVIEGWSIQGSNFQLPYSLQGGSAIAGIHYSSTFIPSRRWVRDDSGTPQTASKLRITDYNFHAEGDDIQVDVVDGPETWPTQRFSSPVGKNTNHRVSFKQRHNEADIVFTNEDVHGIKILQIEWRGTYFKTGRRF